MFILYVHIHIKIIEISILPKGQHKQDKMNNLILALPGKRLPKGQEFATSKSNRGDIEIGTSDENSNSGSDDNSTGSSTDSSDDESEDIQSETSEDGSSESSSSSSIESGSGNHTTDILIPAEKDNDDMRNKHHKSEFDSLATFVFAFVEDS